MLMMMMMIMMMMMMMIDEAVKCMLLSGDSPRQGTFGMVAKCINITDKKMPSPRELPLNGNSKTTTHNLDFSLRLRFSEPAR
ncbi:hypothetical protein EYF80_025245 [Liparis tanakae]|uniref:Secreted protein n=1 Tax=Liparis tanakae TaxID=230148 RepID=A0A4Z2HF43_9TELE|nr:hypothetical protein EYF80_025245 [Liparis tanakae]